jgi:hypothetical protein
MDAAIRFAQARDIDRLGPIENAADALLIERLHPGNWRAAPTSDERETLPGFILVTTGTIDDEDLRNNATNTASNDHAVGFAQVIEANGFAHLEQPSSSRRGSVVMTESPSARSPRFRGTRPSTPPAASPKPSRTPTSIVNSRQRRPPRCTRISGPASR